jgi:hypothetical protein
VKPVFIITTNKESDDVGYLSNDLSFWNIPHQIFRIPNIGPALDTVLARAESIFSPCILASCAVDNDLPDIICQKTCLPVIALNNEYGNKRVVLCPSVHRTDAAKFIVRMSHPYNFSVKKRLMHDGDTSSESVEKKDTGGGVGYGYYRKEVATGVDFPICAFAPFTLNNGEIFAYSNENKINFVKIYPDRVQKMEEHSIDVANLPSYFSFLDYSLMGVYDLGYNVSCFSLANRMQYGCHRIDDYTSAYLLGDVSQSYILLHKPKPNTGESIIEMKSFNVEDFKGHGWASTIKDSNIFRSIGPAVKTLIPSWKNRLVALISPDNDISILDIDKGEEIASTLTKNKSVRRMLGVAFGKDVLGVLIDDKGKYRIEILNPRNLDTIYVYNFNIPVKCFDLNPVDKEIIVANQDGTLGSASWSNGGYESIDDDLGLVSKIAYAPSGNCFAVVQNDTDVSLYINKHWHDYA